MLFVPKMITGRPLRTLFSESRRHLPSSSLSRLWCSSSSVITRNYSSTHFVEKDNEKTFKIAIVGSGPSGCYTAKYLQSPSHHEIDVIERLPTAYGLVRNGVAPDHPEVKNVQNDFNTLFDNSDDKSSVRFFGNVHVGKENVITLKELRQLYDVVVLAFGCESDRTLPIPGHDSLQNILTARQFVNWYDGHPEFDWVGSIVEKALKSNDDDDPTKNIVVIGHGNVALDCARILAKSREELDGTDLTTRALNTLHPINGKDRYNISIVGRRGHVQGAFTIKEVRELTKLEPSATFVVKQDELDAGSSTDASQEELKKAKPRQRIDKLLRDNATNKEDTPTSNTNNNQVNLRFLLNPIRFEGNPNNEKVLGAVVCERTKLEGEIGKQIAVGTGEEETLQADLCLVSIGYKGIPIDGTEQYYDDRRGILTNVNGVVDNATVNDDNLAPLYVSGWLKRGPSGIIGTNIADAKDTVASILKDLQDRTPKDETGKSLPELLQERGVDFIDWSAYQRIEAAESNPNHLRNPQQPREKLTEWNDLLSAAAATE